MDRSHVDDEATGWREHMTEARQRIIRALNDAHTAEQALAHVLQSQIAAAPRGRYRKGLQTHLLETRDHARRIEERLSELEERGNVVQIGIRMIENAVGQSFAMGRAPFDLLGKARLDLLRGSGGPEKVLNEANDACATEALEIATYTGIEGLASSIGDRQTAKLAASIRADEQRMLEHLLEEIPNLVNWVLDAQVRGKAASAIAQNGGRRAAASSDRKARKPASQTSKRTQRKAPRTRKVTTRTRRATTTPRAGGRITGRTAPEIRLPIGNYETLTADEVLERLTALSQIDLAKIDSFERKHENRSSILNRIAALRGGGPSPGRDELEANEISPQLDRGDAERAAPGGLYGGMREGRDSVFEATRK
jgi:ferritin-like metal-binding protein YciE